MILKKLVVLIALLLLFSVSLTCAQSFSDSQKAAEFSAWLPTQGDLIETEYAAGLDPMRIDQMARYEYELGLNERGDPISTAILDLLKSAEEAIANVDLKTISTLVGVNETLLKLDPNLENQIWYQQLMTTASVIIQSNFEVINDTVVLRDKKTNPLYVTHNSTVHSDLISGPYPEGSVACTL